MAEVDLDRLAAAYDHRSDRAVERRITPAVVAADLGPDDLVLDVGGGRGSHGAAIARSGARVVEVDPSAAMLKAATARGVTAVRGRGEQLPFVSGIARLVYFHLSIHHGDWRRMLDEAWRVAMPGGVVWVWTMDPESHRSSFLARWFPRVGEIDAARFPRVEALTAAMGRLGGTTSVRTEVETIERTAGSWVDAVRAGYVSTLHLLTESEIAQGLARFENAHPNPAAVIRYDLALTAVWSSPASVES